MTSVLKKGFQLGVFRVLPLQGEIEGPAGRGHVEPKAIEVLLCLAERPGEVVERDDIVKRVWGRVVVGDESITRCISDLRRALQDTRGNPSYIQTLSKRGYRLLCTPEELSADGARAAVDVSQPVPGFNGRPAIAVLPFENLTRDPDQEYFADGITEDVITALQRFHTFPVISRYSTFVYKGRNPDLASIAKELGVGYFVVGTVRRQGERVRLTVNLIDARDSHGIWGKAYDLELGDLLASQSDIAGSIVAILEVEVQRAESSRPVRTSARDLDLWDLLRKGMWHQSKLTRDDAREAKRLFELALRRDPDSIEALIQMAWWHFWDVSTRRGPPDGWEEMKRLAQRALLRDPHESRALYAIGVAIMMQGDAVAARIPLRQSIELNPSQAWSYATLGTTYILTGDPAQSVEPIRVAMRLSPHDFFIFHAYGELAAAYHMLAQWDSAIEAAEHSLKLRAGYWYAHMLKTASLARAGRREDSARALQALVKRRPDLSVRDIEWLPFVDRQWPRYFAEGLALAGWAPPKEKWNAKTKNKVRGTSDGRFTRAS